MELPEKIARPNKFMKALLFGNTGVGKSKIWTRWKNNSFIQNYQTTVGADFISTIIQKADNQITLQVWDTPCEHHFSMLPLAFCKNIDIVFIVVAADISNQEKLSQIQKWLDWIRQNDIANDNTQIVIIENKIDIENVTLLTTQDLMPFKDRYIFFQSYSAKDQEKEKLNDILRAILPELNFNHALLNARTAYAETKTNIISLNDTHVNMLLTSLRELFIHGPINEPNKSYDMKFGGGKLLNTTIKVPEHVFKFFNDIIFITSGTTQDKKNCLSTIYDELINLSLVKPFTRSTSTHDFYNSLLGFIEHCLTKSPTGVLEYFSLREKIEKINSYADMTTIVCCDIYDKLINGSHDNQDKPYDVTFFGSRKYQYAHRSVNLPSHVAALIHHLTKSVSESNTKLVFTLDFSIAAKFSTSSSRVASTQDFYNKLPKYIETKIAERLQSLENAPSPYHTL